MQEYLLIIIRSVLAFFFILFVARLMGKKQISQLSFFDYIVGITIGNIAAAVAINQGVKISNGILSIIVWTILDLIVAYVALKSFIFRNLVEGSPTIVIQNGKVLEENMRKLRMTFDDLMILLREKNAFKLADIELAVLETNGKMSVMKKTENQPITPKDLGLRLEEDHKPQLVIIDGHVIDKKLKQYGYSTEWLKGEIMKQGAKDFKDVFLAQTDSKGNVYVDLYDDDDKISQVKQRPMVAAQLRKVQADLETFALQTNNQEAKKMYYDHSRELQGLIDQLNPLLK